MGNNRNPVVESTTVKQVLLEFFFLAVAAAFVAFFSQNTPLMSVLIGVNIVVRFVCIRRKNDWVFFLIGFVLGGGNDLLSMIRGVYRYTPPHLLPVPIPFWMLVFWGQIFVAFRQLFQLPVFQWARFPGNPWKPDFRLVTDITVFVLLRVAIYLTVRHEPWPTILFGAIVAVRLVIIPPKKNEWLLIGLVTALGVGYEAALIAFGLYIYHDPVFLGMPAWLIIYWVFMIPLFVKGIFDRVETSLVARRRPASEIPAV